MGSNAKATRHDQDAAPLTLGWREWAALPELGIERLKVKVDTGAQTSALLARKVELFERDGRRFARFLVYPRQKSRKGAIRCEAPVVDVRDVRSSSGHVHRRAVIETEIVMGGYRWPIEITLAKRKDLKFRMLLGRQGLRGHCLVDSGASYLLGRPRADGHDPRSTS